MVYLGRARPPLTPLPSTGRGRGPIQLWQDCRAPVRRLGPTSDPAARALRCGERRRDHSCERLFPPFARSFGAAEGNRILAVVIEGKRRTSTSGQSRERKRVKTDRSHCVFLALCPLRDSLSEEDGTMRCRVRSAHRRRRAARGHAEGGRASRGSAVGRSSSMALIEGEGEISARAGLSGRQASRQEGRNKQVRKAARPTDRPRPTSQPMHAIRVSSRSWRPPCLCPVPARPFVPEARTCHLSRRSLSSFPLFVERAAQRRSIRLPRVSETLGTLRRRAVRPSRLVHSSPVRLRPGMDER